VLPLSIGHQPYHQSQGLAPIDDNGNDANDAGAGGDDGNEDNNALDSHTP